MGRFLSLNIVTFCQGNSSKAPRIQYPQSKHYCVLILSINAFDILCTYYQLFTYIEYFFSFLKQIDYSTYLLIMAKWNLDLFLPLLNINYAFIELKVQFILCIQ